jgi:hypothetical protein
MDIRTRRADDRHTTQAAMPSTPPTPTLLQRLMQRLMQRALVAMRAPLAPQARTHFESFEPRVLLDGTAIAPPRIDGSLDAPGETDRYTFTLSENLRVVFDSLTNNSNIRWSLSGPRGTVVSDRPFSQTDSADLGGDIAYDLAAGDYTLTVDGVADTTGYRSRARNRPGHGHQRHAHAGQRDRRIQVQRHGRPEVLL